MAKRVMIDAGHGGSDYGAVYQNRKEKDDAFRLANEVGRILKDHGVEVGYTRTSDMYLTPYERAKLANEADADLFVSLHRNAFPKPGMVSGAESYIYGPGGVREKTAEAIQRNLEALGFTDLGVSERPNIVVLKRTRMPAVLVQAGYIDAPEDNALFDGETEDVAFAVADGVMTGLGMEQTAAGELMNERSEMEPIQETVSQSPDAAEQTPQMEMPVRMQQPMQSETAEQIAGTPKKPEAVYSVQTGVFQLESNAHRMHHELAAEGFPAYVVFEDGYYKVLVGSYQNMKEAVAVEQRLRDYGYATLLVKRQGQMQAK